MTGRLYENRINAQRLRVQRGDVSWKNAHRLRVQRVDVSWKKELFYKEVKPGCVAKPWVGIYSVAKGGSS